MDADLVQKMVDQAMGETMGLSSFALSEVYSSESSSEQGEEEEAAATEEDIEGMNEEIRELERIIINAKQEGAKRLEQERGRINAIKQKEFARRKKELQQQAFHANTGDFFSVLKGPMYVYRVMDQSGTTDCFMVSKNCSAKTGEFMASWENGQLSMHPWSAATPTAKYPVDSILGRGPFNIMRHNPGMNRRVPPAPVWNPPSHQSYQQPQQSDQSRFHPKATNMSVPIPGLVRSFGGFKRFSAGGVTLPPPEK